MVKGVTSKSSGNKTDSSNRDVTRNFGRVPVTRWTPSGDGGEMTSNRQLRQWRMGQVFNRNGHLCFLGHWSPIMWGRTSDISMLEKTV